LKLTLKHRLETKMTFSIATRLFSAMTLGLCLILGSSNDTHAADSRDVEKLLDNSYHAYRDLTDGMSAKSIETLLKEARGVMIFPSVGKGGLIIGGEGGKGVLYGRSADGRWSPPAFYTMRSVSFGLQAGYQNTRIILIIMNDSALISMLEGKTKLGADASIVLINEGADGEFSTNVARQDIYYYAETDSGLFAGMSLEGSAISTRKKYNRAYYGGKPTPTDIILRGRVNAPSGDRLRAALP
jgi:lipid-binding SYLF domain-containing protein